jgi:hypothetical protein
MKEKIFLTLFLILIVTAGVLYFIPPQKAVAPAPVAPTIPESNTQANNTAATSTLEANVVVEVEIDRPQPSDSVSSPLHIKGRARGFWFFEASLPISVLDANKKVLARIPVQAKGDWMTENFVEFETDITFTKPQTENGFLLVENDNPSGLSQNAKSFMVPVKFK